MPSRIWRSADRSNRNGRRRTDGRFRFRGRPACAATPMTSRHLAGTRSDAHALDVRQVAIPRPLPPSARARPLLPSESREVDEPDNESTSTASSGERPAHAWITAGREETRQAEQNRIALASSDSTRSKSRLRQGSGGGGRSSASTFLRYRTHSPTIVLAVLRVGCGTASRLPGALRT